MVDAYYIGSYWLARRETSTECAERAETLLRLLGQYEPVWERWYETADSFEEARKLPLQPEAAAFEKLFGRKKNRVGDGFNFWLWAGDHPVETTSVSAACGSSTPFVNSVCVLKPPSEGAVADRVLSVSVMTGALRAMALAWAPEWGVATSENHRDAVWQRPKPGTFTGWVTYFSRERGRVPPLPEPVRVEAVEDKGTLVVLTPERFTVSNSEHVALAGRVHALLEGAGLLRPLQPMHSK
ncbi:immunity 52 family protein [Stigmatella sp. ncwal1]|uniref:Immunity 52 family protein n=1 Tax=Stigmatella ashevillensis TaxID=2995309 RepID=A0ABT5DBA7_9BACT|nr:immunity 52 family protein [Stigmatella ashevillena]MDC0710952.1 immunity 52 family protein [Stigmatella ashevillena]